MADDDTQTSAYDTMPVDYKPDFGVSPWEALPHPNGVPQITIPAPQTANLGDAPVAKAGQTVQQPNVMQDISTMPGKVAGAVGDATGVSDAYKAATGQMTPEEQQMFALGAIPMLAGGPEAKVAQSVAEDVAPAAAKAIRAYHGSPYDFNQFDLSKIGTGEGAQAYGHGLYFAENPGTAQAYKESLSDAKYSTKSGEPIETGAAFGQLMNRATDVAPDKHPDIRRGVVNQILQGIDEYGSAKKYADNVEFPHGYQPLYEAVVSKANLLGLTPHKGKMYEVNINADPEHFLDWDKPLSEQHPTVQDALNKISGNATTLLPDAVVQGKNGNYYTMRGDQVVGKYDGWPDADTANYALKVMQQNAVPNYTFGEWQKKLNVPFPEEKLAQLGVPGIKYLDQGSRGYTVQTTYKGQPYSDPVKFATKQQAEEWAAEKRAEGFGAQPEQTGTRNYVVFNDKLIDIVKKYGLAGLVAGGASHFQAVPVDNQPQFDDQQGMARGGAAKATKVQAHYRGGDKVKHCSACSMFEAPKSCSAVRGVISPRGLCDYFHAASAHSEKPDSVNNARKFANGGRVDASNIEHAPTEAQKEAGNYAKDHVRIHGLDITIENAKGHFRRGVDRGGKPWAVKMPAHYGYIKGTVGKDKDHVDVYLGHHLKSPHVWVVDQMNAETKTFDEHKAFLGFGSEKQVVSTYRKAFSDGKADHRLGHITEMSLDEFRDWLKSGDMKKPAAAA